MFAIAFDAHNHKTSGSAVRIATRVRLAPNGGPDFAIARSGTLVFTRSDIPSALGEPIRVDRQGRQQHFPGARVVGTFRRISPDGRRVMLARTVLFTDGLVIKDVQSGAVDTRASDSLGGRPEWLDASTRYYPRRGTSTAALRSSAALIVRAWDGSGRTDSTPMRNAAELVLLHDGKRALFRRDGDLEIARLDALDSPQPITQTASINEYGPVVSPDRKSAGAVLDGVFRLAGPGAEVTQVGGA